MTCSKKLNVHDRLPLTCSRTGTCCHGKNIWINPWEIAQFAVAKEISASKFRDCYLVGGIRLLFDGKQGWKGLSACSQYIDGIGCSVHSGRPLACRLYPLGREIEKGISTYMYQGDEFPCLDGCPEVKELPSLTVEEYIVGQEAKEFERAQEYYLELVQDLADGALTLLLDTGLAASGDRETLILWRAVAEESEEERATRLTAHWYNLLTAPEIPLGISAKRFIEEHKKLLQEQVQKVFGGCSTAESIRDASVMMMTMALHLGRSIGAKPTDLVGNWVSIAKENC